MAAKKKNTSKPAEPKPAEPKDPIKVRTLSKALLLEDAMDANLDSLDLIEGSAPADFNPKEPKFPFVVWTSQFVYIGTKAKEVYAAPRHPAPNYAVENLL